MRDESANLRTGRPRPGSGRGRTGSDLPTPHPVGVLAYDGVGAFELGVACAVFGDGSTKVRGVRGYQVSVCGSRRQPVTVDAGFALVPTHGLDRLRRVGTVVVPPTEHLDRVPPDVFGALRRAHAGGCRIVSLCTGAFVLAEAGLLDGRRATTHWSECAELARRYSGVEVDPGALYVDDGDILTSAGSAASIDLCLYVVRRDLGSDLATRLARSLVVPPQRDGGQAQFIDTPLPDLRGSSLFSDTVGWALEHLDEPLSVGDLASRSAMSPRHFARQFVASTGVTPHQWLQHQRVLVAQRLLEGSELPIEAVARHSGFRTAGNLRKHFTRVVRTSPQAYRRTFQARG